MMTILCATTERGQVGGDERAYRGVGLAGMAVHSIRKWPYAIPEVLGHRSWKNATINGVRVHKRPCASACKVSTRTSWQFKMELKEKKKALRGVLAKLKVNAVRAKEEERKRLQMSREIKLRNRLKSEQYQVSCALTCATTMHPLSGGLRPRGLFGHHV
jgi:hypothetical protein